MALLWCPAAARSTWKGADHNSGLIAAPRRRGRPGRGPRQPAQRRRPWQLEAGPLLSTGAAAATCPARHLAAARCPSHCAHRASVQRARPNVRVGDVCLAQCEVVMHCIQAAFVAPVQFQAGALDQGPPAPAALAVGASPVAINPSCPCLPRCPCSGWLPRPWAWPWPASAHFLARPAQHEGLAVSVGAAVAAVAAGTPAASGAGAAAVSLGRQHCMCW
jgi:hypothetical protein